MLVVIGLLTPSIAWNSLVGFFAYFLFSLYWLKKIGKERSGSTIIAIIATRLLIDFYGIYLYFAEGISSLPHLIIHLSAIISSYFYFRKRKPGAVIPFLVAASFTGFMFFQGWHYWIHRAQHGTFTGRVSYSMPAKFEVLDEAKKLITEDDLKGKIVLLDFWYTRCGYCFVKFPQVESAYRSYKDDPSVMVLAVNKPIEEDAPNQAFEMIRGEGYSFPVVITRDPDMSEKFGISRFPVAFVLNEAGTIIYKGDIEGAVRLVDELKVNSSN